MTFDVEKNLKKYLEESKIAIKKLENKLGHKITDLEFQIALAKTLGYDADKSTIVAKFQLNSDEMIEQLRDFDFPEIIQEIRLEKSILPDGVPIRNDEQIVKSKGEIWEIHKFDKDPFPSNPHAHNKSTGYKLHLGNGELYFSNNKPLGKKISKKDLISLREKIKNVDLPDLI